MESLSIKIDKQPQKGEDAQPIVELLSDQSGLIAVFDGLGGSGSSKYELDGKTFSGAYFASRLAKVVMKSSFLAEKKEKASFDFRPWVAQLKMDIVERFKEAISSLDKNPSKLKSSMIRTLPTTVSGLYFEQKEENLFSVYSLNAGDSRSYCLTPNAGLQQLTKDDTVRKKDALEALFSDTRIANCIQLDKDFTFHTIEFQFDAPFVLLSASDGCFDYVPFPTHFEYILLKTLENSENVQQWEEKLTHELGKVAQDDVSLALVMVGWKGFGEIKKGFIQRRELIRNNFVEPWEQMNYTGTLEKSEMEEERNNLWNKYKSTYEAFLSDKEIE